MLVYAQEAEHIVAAKGLLARIESAILFPLMTLLMALAVLFFLWGAYQFILGASDGTAREEGKKHMLWGIIGIFIMVSAMGILRIAASTFGVDTTPLN